MNGRVLAVGVPEPERLGDALGAFGVAMEAVTSDWAASESLERDDQCFAVVLGTGIDLETRRDFAAQLIDRASPLLVAWQGTAAPEGVTLVLEPGADAQESARRLAELTLAPLQDELQALRAEYAASLPERLMELEQAIDELAKAPAAREVAKRLAHRLAGTAGTYGFTEVSAACRALELTLGHSERPDLEALALSLKRARLGLG